MTWTKCPSPPANDGTWMLALAPGCLRVYEVVLEGVLKHV